MDLDRQEGKLKMEDKRFQQGQELEWLEYPGGGGPQVGTNKCTRIEVIMENGQMGGVPWAISYRADGSTQKHNLALAESVKLKS